MRLFFKNTTEETEMYVQVDPWAGLYRLFPGQTLELITECDDTNTSVEIEDFGIDKIITLPNNRDYFVMRNGMKVHWTEFQTNESDFC